MNIRYGNFFTFPEGTEYGFGAVINFFLAVVWIAGFVGVPLFLTVFFWIPPFHFEKLQTTWWKKRFGAFVDDLELARHTIAYLVLFTVRRTLFAFITIDMAWCLWA